MYSRGERIAKKTIRKYVSRKKQGRRQINQDKRANTAASAGSYIRRFQEQKLEEEIISVLKCEKWRKLFDESDRLFIHAPGYNKGLIYFEGSSLSLEDDRRRSIPIATKTASLVDIGHVFWKLSIVKCSIDIRNY